MVFEDALSILIILLVALSALVFILSDFDILHPPVVFCATMTWSVLLSETMKSKWNLHVSAAAAIVIVTSLIVFCIGSYWSEWCLHNYPQVSSAQVDRKIPISLHLPFLILFSLFFVMAVFVILNFIETYHASIELGNDHGISGMIRTIRLATERDNYKIPRWLSYRSLFSSVSAFTCIYLYFRNTISANEPIFRNLVYLVPVLFYIPMLILSGGRMGLLNLVIFILIVGAVLYERKKQFSLSARLQIVGICVLAGTVFVILFLIFGFFTGKVSLTGRGPFEIIAHYGGLSAPSLSIFLNSTPLETPYIGLTTLWDIYKKLRVLGIRLPENIVFLNIVEFAGVDTNVYTAMRRYIEDFGFTGMYFIMFFLGALYTAFYRYACSISKDSITIVLYATISLPLFFSINDDIFFSHVVKTSVLYQLVLTYLFYKVIVFYNQRKDVKVGLK